MYILNIHDPLVQYVAVISQGYISCLYMAFLVNCIHYLHLYMAIVDICCYLCLCTRAMCA